MDSRQLAGLGSLRLHTIVAGADVHRGAGRLGRGGYLSLRGRLWRDGPPLAGNDSKRHGDRALFQRFRWRFICAPIFLVVVCAAFSVWKLTGIVLVAFIWGVWHGMMQMYGFCRIYDAKVGSFAEVTRRLDFAVCGIWFATAVLLSPQRMTDTLKTVRSAGGPFIPPAVLRAGQQGLLALALLISALFLADFIWMWISGKRPSPVKLVLLNHEHFVLVQTAITSWRAFWLALRCSRYFMMCSTFRSFGFIIGNEWKATALSVGSCTLCSGAVARLWECT